VVRMVALVAVLHGAGLAARSTMRDRSRSMRRRAHDMGAWLRRRSDAAKEEVKVINAEGKTLPPGEVGKLVVRSCSNFGGYLKRPQWNATDANGWFDTGDLAYMDTNGYIRISGRSKDIIIRGGENIPVVEVEALLYKHPAVAQVAIVAYPDERLGERACAVIVPKPGKTIDLAGMSDFLKVQKLAVPYIPEKLIVLDAMPATPSGKIQKFRLREMMRQGEL